RCSRAQQSAAASMAGQPIGSPRVMSVRSAITKSSRAWRNKVAPAKLWPTQCFRNRSRASAAGPVRCRATTRGYLNKVSNTVSDLLFEPGRSDQYSGFSYVASRSAGSLLQRGLQAGRHIILEATYRIRLSDWFHRRLTNARPSALGVAPPPENRTPVPQGTGGCLATTPCDASS